MTEQPRIEDALPDNEEYYRQWVEKAPIVVGIYDLSCEERTI